MLYEMVGIVRPGNVAEVKEIAITLGSMILGNNGVVRSIANWGVYQLPRPVVRHQAFYRTGHHFVLRYDASPAIHKQIREVMALEPRVIHSTHVKLGTNKLQDLVRFGKIDWLTPGEGPRRSRIDGSESRGVVDAERWEGR